MAATMPRPAKLRLRTSPSLRLVAFGSSCLLAFVVGWLAHFGLDRWWLVAAAAFVVTAVELAERRPTIRSTWLTAVPFILFGSATAVVIALSPRALTQVLVAAGYAAWRCWRLTAGTRANHFNELLVLLAVVFEAVFLAAAIWRVPTWACLVVVWACSYILVYQNLTVAGDRLARVLAATWSLIVAEVSWVFLNWLVTYVLFGSYIIVPQAALILTGLAYCFGGIYWSQRQQALTRARLAEYLLITLLLVVIVASSTPWRGTL